MGPRRDAKNYTVVLEDMEKILAIIRGLFLRDPESFTESKREVTVKFI